MPNLCFSQAVGVPNLSLHAVVRKFGYACTQTSRVYCRPCTHPREMDSFEVESCVRGHHVY